MKLRQKRIKLARWLKDLSGMAGTVTMITGVSSWRKRDKIKGALQGGGSTTRYNNSVIRENEANT